MSSPMRVKPATWMSWKFIDSKVIIFDERTRELTVLQGALKAYWRAALQGIEPKQFRDLMIRTQSISEPDMKQTLSDIEILFDRGWIVSGEME